ncbi:MAG: hypothetical protein FWB97_02160 [Oscillospiraceae bacterium]|nr:hypothetical protein [Oscillospiraceae bacterium]
MRAVVDRMWAQLREYMGKMSRGNKIKLAVLSLLVIILAIVTVSILTRTTFATLHTANDDAEAGMMVAALREMGVTPRVEGRRILVPEERVNELRVALAAEGIVGPAAPDLGIMAGAAGFAITDAHARELYDAQLSERVRRAILTSPQILDAHVIIRQGETSPFRAAHGVRAPHAAVMLTLRGGVMLAPMEAQAIAEYIRGAVPGISFENISITDSNLNTYRVGDALTIDVESEMTSRIAVQNFLIEQIRMSVEQQLMPIYGVHNIRVTPSIRLNWDRVSREMIEFAPPVAGELDGIARSAHDLWEAARSAEWAMGIPGTDSNELGTGFPEYPFGPLGDGELYERRMRERNYEINQTITLIEQAQGELEFVSIAVLINAEAIEGDFSAEVADLVSTGKGIPVANVTVQHIPFSYVDTTLADMYAAWEAFQAQQRMRELVELIIQWSVILLLGILLLLLVRTIFTSTRPVPEPETVLVGAGGVNYLADDEDEIDADAMALDEVELQQTKLAGLEQIERFIDKDPAAVAQLLRNWLSDE